MFLQRVLLSQDVDSKTPNPILHHRKVAPEEVLELHKLLQT